MIILITGATGGIGSSLTKKLAKKHSIIAVAGNLTKLNKLKKETNIKIYSLDLSKPNQVRKLFSNISKLDAVINAAALLKPVGKFTENDLNDWRKNIEVNLFGTVYICFFAIPLLLKSKTRGKIINFAGGGSANPRPFHSAYSAGKTAVVRFSETIAKEFPNLDINAIAPGAHNTKMWEDETKDPKPNQWGDLNHLYKFIEFLLSKKSKGITGKFIHYKDNWPAFNKVFAKKDIYTLRRVE